MIQAIDSCFGSSSMVNLRRDKQLSNLTNGRERGGDVCNVVDLPPAAGAPKAGCPKAPPGAPNALLLTGLAANAAPGCPKLELDATPNAAARETSGRRDDDGVNFEILGT